MDTCKHPPSLPGGREPDVLIFGAITAALSAAVQSAAGGVSVLLACRETCLFSELSRAENFYLPSFTESIHPYASILFPAETDADTVACDGLRVLHPDRVKVLAERVCAEYGIDLLYGSVPVSVGEEKAGKTVLLASKFGLRRVTCKTYLDLSQPADLAVDRYIIHIMQAPSLCEPGTFTAPLEDEQPCNFIVRPGAGGIGHATIDCEIAADAPPPDTVQWEVYAKNRSIACLAWLKNHVPEYRYSTPGRFATAGYASGYSVLSEISRGVEIAETLLEYDIPPVFVKELGAFTENDTIKQKIRLPDGYAIQSINPIPDFQEQKLPPAFTSDIGIDKMITADIVVVGGGTAGFMAAVSAARQGLKVVIAEAAGECGGTAVAGGVSRYWYGRRFRDVEEIDRLIDDIYRDLELEREAGPWGNYDRSNPGFRALVYARLCTELSISCYFNTTAFGVVVDRSGKVRGICSSDGRMTLAILGTCIIDATGDGDIAVFAGAAYTYGSSRDMVTLWASLAQYSSPDDYTNNFSTTVQVGDPEDYTRFIRTARLRGVDTYDHGSYPALRESRHIQGLYKISLKDILTFRNYPDTLYTCFSNYDPKGKSTADAVYAGFLPPPMAAAVPLSALLPKDTQGKCIEGVIVAGKAFSATHDAFPGLRMQTDLMHQGTAVGLAATMAVKQGSSLREIDIKTLQGMLSSQTGDPLTVPAQPERSAMETAAAIQADDRKEWTDLPFADEIDVLSPSAAALLCEASRILPELEAGIQQKLAKLTQAGIPPETDRKLLLLAQLLLWHGSDLGTAYLMRYIEKTLNDPEFPKDGKFAEISACLPERTGSLQCVQLLPDHGVMAELVYCLNLLAWSKRRDIYRPFKLLVSRLQENQRDYRSNRKSIYHYIETCAYAAERTLLPEFRPLLKTLIKLPEFEKAAGSLREQGRQEVRKPADGSIEPGILEERLVILLMTLYRALARCGDREGYQGLVSLLACPVLTISLSACTELRSLTKKTLPNSSEMWLRHISQVGFSPVPQAVTGKIW